MMVHGKGFAVLTGEVGVGKTLLSRIFLRSLDKSVNSALILFPQLSEAELVSSLCDELKIEVADSDLGSVKSQIDRLNRGLMSFAAAGQKTVVVIDEAQRLPLETLEMIRLLTNLETSQRKLLQIILIGQPELEAVLAKSEIRQLNQRVSVRGRLEPFNAKEVERYIHFRIEKAGGANFVRFDGPAVEWLTARTHGIPRLLNQDCERLIRAAETARTHLITRSFAMQILEGSSGFRHSLRQLLHRGGISP